MRAILFIFLWLSLCFSKDTIMVSLPVEKYFVKQIVQDKFDIQPLVFEEPYGSKYIPSTLAYIASETAVMYFKIGLWDEENWLKNIKSKNPNIKIYDFNHNITLDEDYLNTWLDPINAQKQLKNIYKFMAQYDPKNEEFYKKNYLKAFNHIASIDYQIRVYMQHTHSKIFISFNRSYHYFAKRYKLKNIVQTVDLLSYIDKTAIDIINQIERENTKIAFIPTNYFPKSLVKHLKKDLKYKIVKLSVIDSDWEYIVFTLAKSLQITQKENNVHPNNKKRVR